MDKIKIEAWIDALDSNQVQAAVSFLQSLRPTELASTRPVEKIEEKPARKKSKPEKKSVPEPKDEGKITIDQVRKLLSSKVEKHRVALKEKLTELGAPNVTNLNEDKYEEFMEFLNSLD